MSTIPVNDLQRGFKLFQNEYEEKALDVLRSGWYILGKEVENFEIEYAHRFQENCYVAGVDNGLNAIHIGLLAAGIKPGDEIIVQANGYIATMLGIIQCGAIPVFVEPNQYYGMNSKYAEDAISEKTKAILVTHLYGLVTEMDDLVKLCKKHHLLLFEDCAQAHFATYREHYAGLFGDASFFSFYPTKNLGAFGDGGAVVSRNADLINKVKALRNYGSDRRYHNIYLGFNARLDELQAGLLRVKLKHYEELLRNRSKIAHKYLSEIHNSKITLPEVPNESTHIWYQFVIRVNQREEFQTYMKENGVATDIAWKTPPYLQPSLAHLGYHKGSFPYTEKLCREIVSIPMMDYMSEEEVLKIIKLINNY